MLDLNPFLTAYDPSDLPGTSVDPLGFERGYLFLADKILPGLTNVASRPRYFSLLCAALKLAEEAATDAAPPKLRRQRRLEVTQRLERFWALACVLATAADGALDATGIRGWRYVNAARRRLEERGATSTKADYRLLSRQATYGMLGAYGATGDGLRLLDRGELVLSPDLGRRLADAFLTETELPAALRKAVREGGEVSLDLLAKWGRRAHLAVRPGVGEATVLNEALEANDVRRRMVRLLRAHPPREGESELSRFERIRDAADDVADGADLREALTAISAFEHCYRLSLLAFHRLLWFCQQDPLGKPLEGAAADGVIERVHAELPGAMVRLRAAVDGARTLAFREDLARLDDVLLFLAAAESAASADRLLVALLARHRAVQQGKLHRGRPKMPWIELAEGWIKPTLSAAQWVPAEPEDLQSIVAHPYRSWGADRFTPPGGAA